MLGTVVKESGSLFDRRFFLSVLLPTLAFLCGAGVLTAGVVLGPNRARAAWSALPLADIALLAVAVIASAVVVATLLSGWAVQLVRWYEGYWPTRLGTVLGELGCTWHRRKRNKLVEAAQTDQLARGQLNDCYPPATPNDPAMPTRLGNALLSAERHPRVRYGIDTVVVWPRLYPLLPDRVVTGLIAGRADMESRLVTATLFGVFALYAGMVVLLGEGRWWLFASCFGGGMLGAWFFYGSAVSTAIGYAEQVKAAFDVYRLDLLRQLDETTPLNPLKERRRWRELSLLWLTGVHNGDEEPPELQPPIDRGARFMIVSLGAWASGAVGLVCLAGSVFLSLMS